ncbi:hypothetical protein IFM89_014569 [Coptis chinensis]|uniref:Uncharacterized protein n=1 Tax=Coptis chinensis TaxID=261450 RepID=A0A835GZC3_9MAGN|nr:hypothetical protein IFM89_014569 [Coptis chinensis]
MVLTGSAFVGVNIGTDVTNLPSLVEVVAILKANRSVMSGLFDADRAPFFVGGEVLTTIPNAARFGSAMNYIHRALVASNLNFSVKVSSPQSMDVIPKSFPPSTASFNSRWKVERRRCNSSCSRRCH